MRYKPPKIYRWKCTALRLTFTLMVSYFGKYILFRRHLVSLNERIPGKGSVWKLEAKIHHHGQHSLLFCWKDIGHICRPNNPRWMKYLSTCTEKGKIMNAPVKSEVTVHPSIFLLQCGYFRAGMRYILIMMVVLDLYDTGVNTFSSDMQIYISKYFIRGTK